MSISRKCDRCNEYYDEYNITRDKNNINALIPANTDRNDASYTHKHIDLCPTCMMKFHSWMEEPEHEDEHGWIKFEDMQPDIIKYEYILVKGLWNGVPFIPRIVVRDLKSQQWKELGTDRVLENTYEVTHWKAVD